MSASYHNLSDNIGILAIFAYCAFQEGYRFTSVFFDNQKDKRISIKRL